MFVPDDEQKKKPGAAKTTNEDVPNGSMRGVMQLDCLTTPEGCQNACYYQNCVMGAKGDYTKVTYQKSDLDMEQYNRVQSGQGVSGAGTPCNTEPFAQKFWDTYPFNTRSDSKKFKDTERFLEADEWPMASMYNPDFDPANGNARSLRCSSQRGNGQAGAQAKAFYRRFGE